MINVSAARAQLPAFAHGNMRIACLTLSRKPVCIFIYVCMCVFKGVQSESQFIGEASF